MSPGLFQPIYPNPYIVGNPIRSREMFFGRLDEFHFIARALDDGRKAALIVLFGERRSGKSSILYQIQNGQLGEAFLPIFVDMQIMAGIASEVEFFSRLIADTSKALGKEAPETAANILRPDDSNPADGFRKFLWTLKEHFPGRALLLLIDEYEILERKITEGCLSRNVLTFFGGLLESEQVSFVFTGSKKLESHNAELWGSALLQKATSRKISFLTRDDTTRLVTQPLENKVTFAPEVLEQIYALTAGQPFYTQLICQNLVYHLNEVKKYFVERQDLETVVTGILDNPPPQLIFNWGEHPAEHKLTLALLAEFSQKPGQDLSTASIRHRIRKNKLDLVLDDAKLKTWLTDLVRDEYLLQQDYRFSFRLDLFRRWIRHDHNIWQVKKEIGQEELNRICEREKIKKEQKRKIIIVLERVALAMALVALFILGRLVYYYIFYQQVEVSGNGGPFVVSAVAGGDTARFRAEKQDDAKRYFDEKKLRKGKTYTFIATLPASNETQSKTMLLAKNTIINFNFREYPVLVFTDADSIIAELGAHTIRTKGQIDSWKHTFNVPAGEYMLRVRDASTGELKKRRIAVRAARNYDELVEIDFDSVFTITLQAKSAFKYLYRTNATSFYLSNSYTLSEFSPTLNLYSEIIRGCKKGRYQFKFLDLQAPDGEQRQIDRTYELTQDTTITIEFDDRPKPRPGKRETTTLPPPPASRSKYKLQITSRQDSARVTLNSVPIGYTPFDTILAAGTYVKIIIEKEGFDPHPFEYELNKDLSYNADLTPQFGFLKVTVKDENGKSPTGVSVFGKKEDGDKEELWGDARKIAREGKRLLVGRYKIRAVSDEYHDGAGTAYVYKNEWREINITLTKK